MEIRASARHLPMSAQKMRLVCDQVRDMDADQALVVLQFMPHKGAQFLYKLLKSAVANAENNFELDHTDLYIQHLSADEGVTLKRMKAGARGRYKPRLKRTCHIQIVLKEREEEGLGYGA